jgi:nucleotide-binding universal stress UspA family protein
MRVLVWLVPDTWEATIREAAAFIPSEDITLLHVTAADVEEVALGARAGLLGRSRRTSTEDAGSLHAISEEAALALLSEAQTRLGRQAALITRRGRVEREVVAAAEGMDLLILARDGDRSRLGPRSLGPAARFVVDHAPCRVLLIWPDQTPGVETVPPPPAHGAPPPGERRPPAPPP